MTDTAHSTAPAAAPAGDIGARVRAELIAMAFRLTPATLVATLLTASIILYAFSTELPVHLLVGWTAGIFGVTALRYALIRAYARAAPTPAQAPRWLNRFSLLTFLAGALWGLLGTVLFPVPGSPYQGVMGIILVAVSAVGLFTLPLFSAYCALALPALAPGAVMLLASARADERVIGVAMLVFLFVALINSRRAERSYAETLRLRMEIAEVAEQRSRAVEAAQAASRAKSEFLARMSHEIRTPMNGVLGMAQLLMETPLNSRQQGFLHTLYRSGEGLLDIINDVLDFTKIEAGRLELEHIDFDLRASVAETMAPLSERALSSGLTLNLRIDDAIPAFVNGDPVRLRQVLSNLVANALKFTPQGHIDVRATLAPPQAADAPAPQEGEATRVYFSVSDTGVGIPPQARSRIFDAFAQADVSHTRKYGGTGLGLAICRQLVELMGGSIGLTSEPGAGSTFWFSALLGPATGAAPKPAPLPLPSHALTAQHGRVLLVEDNPVNREVARMMLDAFGVEVVTAENGLQALAATGERDYDLILMDCEMPEMDGFEATRRLRARETQGGARRTPIVALTAHAVAGDRERCLACGMDDYLSKPFRREELHAVLARWIAENLPAAQVPVLH